MNDEKIPFKAIIMFAHDNSARVVKLSLDKNPSFTYNDQTYQIRPYARYLYVKRKFKLGKLGKVPFPRFVTEREYRSYYRAGNPEPITWTRPEKFSAEDLYVMESENTTVKGISNALMGARRRKQLGALKWMLILMLVIGGIAAIVILLPNLLRFFGMG